MGNGVTRPYRIGAYGPVPVRTTRDITQEQFAKHDFVIRMGGMDEFMGICAEYGVESFEAFVELYHTPLTPARDKKAREKVGQVVNDADVSALRELLVLFNKGVAHNKRVEEKRVERERLAAERDHEQFLNLCDHFDAHPEYPAEWLADFEYKWNTYGDRYTRGYTKRAKGFLTDDVTDLIAYVKGENWDKAANVVENWWNIVSTYVKYSRTGPRGMELRMLIQPLNRLPSWAAYKRHRGGDSC